MINLLILAGVVIGILLGLWFFLRRKRKDDEIITLLSRGVITVNEARSWRETGVPPKRLTQGALSPYD